MPSIATTPVTFTRLNSGRVEVMLGNQVVGQIMPWSNGKHRFYFRMLLPVDGGCSAPRPASSVSEAREGILNMLADWFDCAGEMFSPIAATIRAQAEEDLQIERQPTTSRGIA